MAANQVMELSEEVDPVLSFFAYQPLRATAKPGDSKCGMAGVIFLEAFRDNVVRLEKINSVTKHPNNRYTICF